jgi:surfeit locus 1 family protein
LAALAILVALGTWQLQRLAWKADLTRRIEQRTAAEPGAILPEARWREWDAESDEFRRVRVSGTFLHDREVTVHGLRPEGQGPILQGYYVFTPLRLDDGTTVIVNRGFVPTELKAPARRAEGQVAGPTTVTGLVRAPEKRAAFVPPNEPGKEAWFVRDPNEMAAARGLSRTAPFYVEADTTPNPGGWPRGGRAGINLPNNHLQYALTWFGLALTLAGVFAAFAWQRLKRGDRPADRQAAEAR